MIDALDDVCEEDGIEIPNELVSLRSTLLGAQQHSVQFLSDVTGLVRQRLSQILRGYTKESSGVVQNMRVCDVSRNVLSVGLQELQISQNQDSHEEGEHRGYVLGFEAKNPKCGSKITVSDGVVAERASRQPVTAARGEKRVIGNVFKGPGISLLWSGSGEKLVEDVVCSFLVRKVVETGFIKAISQNLCGGNTASVVEKELEVASVTRGVGVSDRFSVAKGFEERAKCTDLISNF
jgi:hypothetical protein